MRGEKMKLLEHNHTIDIVKLNEDNEGLKFVVKPYYGENIIEIVNFETDDNLLYLSYNELNAVARAILSCKRFLKDYE
jgi:hypothetical protein